MTTFNKTKILILIIVSVNSVGYTKRVRMRTYMQTIFVHLRTWLLYVRIQEEQPKFDKFKNTKNNYKKQILISQQSFWMSFYNSLCCTCT